MEIFWDYFAFLIDYNRTIDKDCVYLSLNSCKCVIACFGNIFYLAVDFHKMATLLDSFPESTSARLFPRAKTNPCLSAQYIAQVVRHFSSRASLLR